MAVPLRAFWQLLSGYLRPQWARVTILAAVLFAKARREERGMALAHPGYADYRARTRAIVPFIL